MSSVRSSGAAAKLTARLAGGLIERIGASPAPMWGAVHGPAAVCAGGLLGSRRLRLAGAALSAGYAAAMANIACSRAVPAANDNLSGVAVLLELAARLSRRPPHRLRVLLLSTGSEESFLEAMVRFGERHFNTLKPAETTFLCLESVGSPQLMLLSGEGLLRLRRYPTQLIETLTSLAAAAGVRLRDPFRYRLATDGQVPLLAGYPVAVISSMDWYKVPSNYHRPTDRPENLPPTASPVPSPSPRPSSASSTAPRNPGPWPATPRLKRLAADQKRGLSRTGRASPPVLLTRTHCPLSPPSVVRAS